MYLNRKQPQLPQYGSQGRRRKRRECDWLKSECRYVPHLCRTPCKEHSGTYHSVYVIDLHWANAGGMQADTTFYCPSLIIVIYSFKVPSSIVDGKDDLQQGFCKHARCPLNHDWPPAGPYSLRRDLATIC